MAGSYERSGKPKLPDWWTRLAFPLLESDDVDFGDVAAKASEFVGRQSAWKRDAISKFKSGVAVTRELANGISHALGIPQPFFEARSPGEAAAIMAVMRITPPTTTNPDQLGKAEAAAQGAEAVAKELFDQIAPVQSAHEGRTGSRRTGRPARRR